jgi:hypothetical protein
MSALIRRKLKKGSCNSHSVLGSMRIRYDDQVKDFMKNRACSTHDRDEKSIENFGRKT